MLVSEVWLGNNLNVHAKPENLRASRNKTRIQVFLIKVKQQHH